MTKEAEMKVKVKVAQLYLTHWNPMVSSPWNSPGQNTGAVPIPARMATHLPLFFFFFLLPEPFHFTRREIILSFPLPAPPTNFLFR